MIRYVPKNPLLPAILAITVALSISGCARSDVDYIPAGATYTKSDVGRLLDAVDSERYTDTEADDAKVLRERALVDVRERGTQGAEVASLLTQTIPDEPPAVPLRIERGSYEGTPSILVIEATGRAGEKLSGLRLWVLSAQGDVLYTEMR